MTRCAVPALTLPCRRLYSRRLRKARIAERKRVRFAGIERLRLSVQQVLGQGVRRGHLKRDIVDNLVVRVAVAEAEEQVGVRARLVEVLVGGLPREAVRQISAGDGLPVRNGKVA